jgi:hypothetical protein
MSFEDCNKDAARRIADAVMYEGYVLYPYRPSSAKNQYRWQFGIVAPRAWSENGGDPWEMQTECLVEPYGPASVDITIRFLQVQLSNQGPAEWEEGNERTIDVDNVPLATLVESPRDIPFSISGDPAINGLVRLSAQPSDSFFKLRVRIENHTDFPEAAEAHRSTAMRRSLVGTHTMLAVAGGAFISSIDPPPAARAAVGSCSNLHTWPVLVGEPGSRDTVLSSPIILEDYPAIAPESHADFCDATEIDELLTLRVMTLTEEEKREAAQSDERARRIIEHSDNIPPEIFERLHGAVRSLSGTAAEQFFNPPEEQPEKAEVEISGSRIARGARVRLAPKRLADSMDLFLQGRIARVEAVHHDVEDRIYVAVTVEDDPAADMRDRVGRFFYFHPDEIELIGKET